MTASEISWTHDIKSVRNFLLDKRIKMILNF